jgi:hypothetical protein
VRLQLKDGEARFTKGGFAHKAVNLSDKPFVNVTVELKKGTGQNSDNLFERASFTNIETQIVVQSAVRCTDYSSSRSGGGAYLPKGKNRLLVASTKTQLEQRNGRSELLDQGEIKWTQDGLQPRTTKAHGNFLVCEFAQPGQDLLKASPQSTAPAP